jgi:hypothetical protein
VFVNFRSSSLHLGGKLQLTVGHRISQDSVLFFKCYYFPSFQSIFTPIENDSSVVDFCQSLLLGFCVVYKNEIKFQDAANHFKIWAR